MVEDGEKKCLSLTLEDILMFSSGASSIPPFGINCAVGFGQV